MNTLIILQGLGVNGKSTEVEKLMKDNPEIIHIPQFTRGFLEKHGNFKNNSILAQHVIDELNKFEVEDHKIYITERMPASYLCMSKLFVMETSDPVFINERAYNHDEALIEYERIFRRKFNQVFTYFLLNYDLRWLEQYFKELKANNPTHVHSETYKSRGNYIRMQDLYHKFYDRNFGTDYCLCESWCFPEEMQYVHKIIQNCVNRNKGH